MLLEMCIGSRWPHAVFSAKIFSSGTYAGPLPEHLAAVIRLCLDQVPEERPTATEVQKVTHVQQAVCLCCIWPLVFYVYIRGCM